MNKTANPLTVRKGDTATYGLMVHTDQGQCLTVDLGTLAPGTYAAAGVQVVVGEGQPAAVTTSLEAPDDRIASLAYRISLPLRNYDAVIVPDTGRSYCAETQTVFFWGTSRTSSINAIRTPLFLFTGMDRMTALGFGIIGPLVETSFSCVEPATNRALVAWMKRLTLEIRRGTPAYPLSPEHAPAGQAVTEHLWTCGPREESWVMTLRAFCADQQRIMGLGSRPLRASMEPLWCSWTDWFSDDVTDEVIMDNVRAGLKLGITNYIIDDGWFGPGLDNDYNVNLNIGDWDADPAKIPDMAKLVRDMKAAGARPMIWCAPHAVAPHAKVFKALEPLLIRDAQGDLVMTSNCFHSLCFQCPQARGVMADLCASFIERWDVDGAKYDLFNCVPDVPCCNPDHKHDTPSMVEGLRRTLALIDQRCRVLKPDYIVELKQNYGTPALLPYGTMMRAGDTPYCPEGNFLRTAYIQGYTPLAINDYQTITPDDSPQDAACLIIKMLSVGIPSYSIDFSRLEEAHKAVIAHYNHWYHNHLDAFMQFREPCDPGLTCWKLGHGAEDLFFLVNNGHELTRDPDRATVILNGSDSDRVLVRGGRDGATLKMEVVDCQGSETCVEQRSDAPLLELIIPRGGMALLTDA